MTAAIAVVCLLSAPVAADEYSDLRIPAHRLYGWTASLSSEGDALADGGSDIYTTNRALQGSLLTQGFWISDSDSSRTSIDWSVSGGGSRFRRRDRTTHISTAVSFEGLSEIVERAANESWRVSLDHRIYPFAPAFGFEGSAFAMGDYFQDWYDTKDDQRLNYPSPRQTQISQQNRNTWSYYYNVVASIAFGFGRVRDATRVLDARVFEDRLRRAGALSRPLSREGRERLAALAYVQYGYTRVHDRAGKYLWPAIERILRDDGALADSVVDPAAVLRAAEPYLDPRDGTPGSLIPSSPVARTVGVFAGPVLSGRHTHAIDRSAFDTYFRSTLDDTVVSQSTGSFSQRQTQEIDQLFGGGKIEFHRPLGPRWQVDASEQLQIPLRPHRQGIEHVATAEVNWLVADRWLAGVGFEHQRSIEHTRRDDLEPEGDRWYVRLDAWLTFYLEDRVQLRVNAQSSQRMSRVPTLPSFAGPPSTDFNRSQRISLDLTYRFLGGLDAPGLITPLRLGSRLD
jgi:hypothetical protein